MQYKIESLATFDKEVKRLSKRYPSMAADIKALKAKILAILHLVSVWETTYVKYVCALLPKVKAKVEGHALLLLRL